MAGVIDSQSVHTTESSGAYCDDAGKRINGRKWHSITDNEPNMVVGLTVHTAYIQERDGTVSVIDPIRSLSGGAASVLRRRLCWGEINKRPNRPR